MLKISGSWPLLQLLATLRKQSSDALSLDTIAMSKKGRNDFGSKQERSRFEHVGGSRGSRNGLDGVVDQTSHHKNNALFLLSRPFWSAGLLTMWESMTRRVN